HAFYFHVLSPMQPLGYTIHHLIFIADHLSSCTSENRGIKYNHKLIPLLRLFYTTFIVTALDKDVNY
ncbi:hypothetical protein, partial [Lysinibacillus sp. UBA5994]|uniref:hypothetical protein n=1 Tax=Lysinibacillus sp. UBA5994 TaxID=1946774 RepID=UPI002596193D